MTTGLETEAPPLGLTVEIDGDLAGLGGAVWFAGACWVFFAVYDERMRSAIMVHRRARKFLNILQETGEPLILALCDEWRPRAMEWMRRLGFEPTEQTLEGRTIWALKRET